MDLGGPFLPLVLEKLKKNASRYMINFGFYDS